MAIRKNPPHGERARIERAHQPTANAAPQPFELGCAQIPEQRAHIRIAEIDGLGQRGGLAAERNPHLRRLVALLDAGVRGMQPRGGRQRGKALRREIELVCDVQELPQVTVWRRVTVNCGDVGHSHDDDAVFGQQVLGADEPGRRRADVLEHVMQEHQVGLAPRLRQALDQRLHVANDKVFDEPVYNYTREFPYIWDEINLPIKYGDDANKAQQILLAAARRHALTHDKIGSDETERLRSEFGIEGGDVDPCVYWRMTDNWLELSVRFLAPDHGTRPIKDAMSREILAGLNDADIEIASGTYAIVEMPPLRVDLRSPAQG